MRENAPQEIRTLAADESLAYVREIETLEARINDLHTDITRGNIDAAVGHRLLGRTNQRLGIAMRLAQVHADLAVAEQLTGLRADLNAPPAPLDAGRETVRLVPLTDAEAHDRCVDGGLQRGE